MGKEGASGKFKVWDVPYPSSGVDRQAEGKDGRKTRRSRSNEREAKQAEEKEAKDFHLNAAGLNYIPRSGLGPSSGLLRRPI